MAPRATFKGAISFGLVSAPVRLYKARDESGISLHLVHRECGGRISQLRKCKTCEQEVDYNDLDRGFELSKEQTVVLTQDDLDSLPLKSSKTIEVEGFLESDDHPDPIYWGDEYYLAADDAGLKPFMLLITTMRERGLLGLCRITLRSRERMALIRPLPDGRCLLTLLFWGDEVRDDPAYYANEGMVTFSDKELDLARTLVGSMIADGFDPTETRDAYAEAMKELIAAKLEGGQVAAMAEAPEPKVDGLEAMLEQAVAEAKKGASDGK